MPEQPEPESHPPTTSPQTLVYNYSKSPQTANNEFRIYIRRKRPERTIEQPTPLTYDQESQQSPSPTQIHSGKGIIDLEKPVPFVDDSNISIALRKGVRTCIDHPICRFISYDDCLSPTKILFRFLIVCRFLILFRRLSRIQSGERQSAKKSELWRRMTHG